MEAGAFLKEKGRGSELLPPIFIWDVIENKGQVIYIVNSESGISKSNIESKFFGRRLILPDSARFQTIPQQILLSKYDLPVKHNYETVTDLIKKAKNEQILRPALFINMAYGYLWFAYLTGFIETDYCKNATSLIENDKYSTVKSLSSIHDPAERFKQNCHNLHSLLTLNLIPKRFVLLYLISKFKEIVKESFPPKNDGFTNAIFEKLSLGMFLYYYKTHEEKIKSVTINYIQKFPGDFKVHRQFTLMLDKFEEEITLYKTIEAEELKIELNMELSGKKMPEREDGKGIIMKLLEFDLSFWQRLILLDIDKDVPVRKPYKDGHSQSYNYMLLLPFFQWLAPHLFPSYEDKKVDAKTYHKNMVERMKSFIEGKIS